jgi:putative restriction endonuclease
MKIQVSEKAHGTSGFDEWLMRFHGKPLRAPQHRTYFPEPQLVHWHVREVFRGPFRYLFE